MKRLNHARNFLAIIILSIATFSCSAFSYRFPTRKTERQISGSSRGFREPRKVRMAKKQQEANENKRERQYASHVKNSRKRSYEIQSPKVKERMKQNEAAINAREKARDKRTRSSTKKAGKKYGR